jgi:hypothetical protein
VSIIATALAKLAAVGIPAQAAAVALVVAAGATGGVVAHAAVTTPDPAVVPESAPEILPADEGAEEEENGEQPTLPDAASFGQSVAEDARDGGVVGLDIAEQARARAEERRGEAIPDHAQEAQERNRPEVQAVTPEIPEPRGRPEDAGQRP